MGRGSEFSHKKRVVSFSLCVVCIFCSFTPFISILFAFLSVFFVFHREDSVLFSQTSIYIGLLEMSNFSKPTFESKFLISKSLIQCNTGSSYVHVTGGVRASVSISLIS